MNNQNMIELDNISHSFGDRQILNDFNLTVKQGDKYIFSAPSGYGKSTIFNMIMGFIEPDFGKVIIDGVEINDENVLVIRSKIAYLPQNISLPNVSVSEFVRQVTTFSNNAFSRDIFTHWIGEVDLPYDILDSMLFLLSGGEKQRLMLCICLALNKKILLIDEGLTGVDNERTSNVLSLLLQDEDLTVLYITHDITHASINGFKRLEVK